MKTNVLLASVLTVVVGIILAGSVLVPVINDAQRTAGDEVVYTNNMNSTNHYHYDYVDSVMLTATAGASNWENITVNGQDIAVINDYMLAIVSDGFALQIGGAGQLSPTMASPTYTTYSNIPNSEQTVSIEFKNGNWTVTGGVSGIIYEGTYTWVVTYDENGKYIARNGNPTNFYNSGSPSDFIVYGGVYTSGELDTFYSYGMGKFTASVTGYSGEVNLTNTAVSGTTDVFRCNTCSVTVTDGEDSESYTPYRSLVKETIIGHKDSGASYTIYGIIPMIVIIALFVSVAGVVIKARNE